MRVFSVVATVLLVGLTACASGRTEPDTTASDSDVRTVDRETVGNTTITVEAGPNDPVQVIHRHYPYPGPQFSQPQYGYGVPPRNFHTHTGGAAVPAPSSSSGIDYAPMPAQPYQGRGVHHPPRKYGGHGGHGGYRHMTDRRIFYGDHHNRTPAPIPASAGIGHAEVAEAQHNLAQLGFYPGPIDGLYGPLTRRAVIAYTSHQGMPTDGRVTHSLLTYLRSDLAERIRPPSVSEQHGPYYR